MDKVIPSPADAVADIPDGASLAVGGFGLSGNPMKLIEALHDRGTTDLRVVSNNCGVDDWAGKFDHLADICQVVYLPRTPSISTTAVIEKITRMA
jgi:acyl CoA:acetate/3-ketoacid CoA transferase alpha subunit